jgi:hypothetical protein
VLTIILLLGAIILVRKAISAPVAWTTDRVFVRPNLLIVVLDLQLLEHLGGAECIGHRCLV